jgi:hypothetical protein
VTFDPPSQLEEIGEGCFSKCSLLKEVTIPSNVIYDGAFDDDVDASSDLAFHFALSFRLSEHARTGTESR